MLIEWLRTNRRTLLGRFTLRVLLPAFVLLLVLSAVIFWLYSQSQREQAMEELNTAAETTAVRVEREVALRRTALTTTGAEIFQTKQDYQKQRSQLKSQRKQCRQHYKDNDTESEDQACSPFAEELAALPPESRDQLKAIERGYVSRMKSLNQEEASETKQRLDAFSTFFPETLALMVVDTHGKRVSTARAESVDEDADIELDSLHTLAEKALTTPVRGKVINSSPRQAVFAYPIENGAVLASFNLDHPQFLHPSIAEAPVNLEVSRLLIVHGQDGVIYPDTATPLLEDNSKAIASDAAFQFEDQDVIRSGVSADIENTEWHATAASPRAIVLAPLRDAQIAAFLLLGGLLVTLLWVGTIYIRRLTHSIQRLVAGAQAFSNGNLDYRIELENANTEFLQLTETMNDMAAHIAEAEAEIDRRNKEFINIASHELRTPITGIIGSLSTVLEDKRYSKFGTKTKKLLRTAHHETVRLRDLLNELLNIARLEGGEAEFKREHINVEESINEVSEILKSRAEEKNITLHYDSNDDIPAVIADSSKLQVVLTNLISNAIKYNYEDSTVHISHTVRGGSLVTHVRDEGFGIPEDQQSNMFQKFYRVSSSDHKRISGTGLGLYTAKQYIESMAGSIWFESKQGNGTTFSFTLPFAE